MSTTRLRPCVSQRVMIANLESSYFGKFGTVAQVLDAHRSDVNPTYLVRLDSRTQGVLPFAGCEIVNAPNGNRALVAHL